jgi:flagellar basal body L-ring protein FlgH
VSKAASVALIGLLAASALSAGCSWFSTPAQQRKKQDEQAQATTLALTDPARLRSRPPVNTTRNMYEGSLWRGAASWGNLMRDHRARYVGDLLTVNDMPKIIKVPEEKKPAPGATPAAAAAPAAPEKPNPNIDPVLAFLKEQEKRLEDIEKEQNEVLRSVENVEVEVIRVLPNGNMVVRGIIPPIYRDRSRVKYVITLRGIVRPSDVDDNNAITATKLSKAEYKIQRLVKRPQLPLGAVARASGKPKEGALIDRLTDFATSPGGSRTTQVRTN